MRCHEARRRLKVAHAGSSRGHDSYQLDAELRQHIQGCASCRRLAQSSDVLGQLFAAAAPDNRAGVRSLASSRVLIEAEAAAAGQLADARTPGDRRDHRHTWIPVGAGIMVAAAMLVLVAIVPFDFGETVSYEVAFHGVERDVAEDGERLCDVFYNMGLSNAAVDIQGCDTTCQVVVFDLKSEQEVQLAVAVLRNMNARNLTVRVIPVRTTSEQTLLGRASERLL